MKFAQRIAKFISLFIPGRSRREFVQQFLCGWILIHFVKSVLWLRTVFNLQKSLPPKHLPDMEIYKGKRCIVVGSAPGVRVPKKQDGDVVIAVNSGAVVAQKSGRGVDVFCTTAALFNEKDNRNMQIRAGIQDFSVSLAYIYWYYGEKISLSDFGISAKTTHWISKSEREQIIKNVCGFALRVSSGLFAVCIAILSGAASVEMVGFSLTDYGHANLPSDSLEFRDHVAEDTAFLIALAHTPHADILKLCKEK